MRISIRVKRAISIFLCFVMLFTTVDLSALRTLAAEGEPEIELENSAEESSEDEADAAEDEESDEDDDDDDDAESEEDSGNSDSSEDSDDSIKDDDDDSDDAVSDDNADEDDKDDADDNDQQDDADEETVSENEADKDDEDTVSENAADTDEEDSDKFVFSLSRDDAAIWLPYGEYDSFEENIGTLQLEYTIDSDAAGDEEKSETSDAADEQDDEQEIKISWESEDESVATVDGDGLVSAVSEGETLITATVVLDEEEYSASCSVTVEQGVIDVVRTTDDGETIVASFADLDSVFAFLDDADNDLRDGAAVRIFSDMEIGYAGADVMDIDEGLSFDVRGNLKIAGNAALIVNGALVVTGDTVIETGAVILNNGRVELDTINIEAAEKETEEEGTGYAYIARYYGDDENAGAEFAIKGLIKGGENAGLKIGLLDEKAAASDAALKTIDDEYRLYDTEISEIAECVSVWLEEGTDAGYSGLAFNEEEAAVFTAPMPLYEDALPDENVGASSPFELYEIAKNPDGTYPGYKDNAGTLVDGYDSWTEAIAAINSKKDKTLRYRMVVNNDIGSVDQPITLTFPSSGYYAGLYVESTNDSTIYYTNKITLNAALAFHGVDLAPVKAVKTGTVTSYQGTILDISPGGYELIMDRVGLHTVNGVDCGIGSISGNGKNALTIINVDDNYGESGLDIRTGDVKAATLTLEGQLNIDKGSLSVTDMVMKSGSVLKSMGKAVSSTGTLNMQGNAQVISYSGAVNLKNVDLYAGGAPTSGNEISFGRTSKNETTLKITGKVNTDADHKLGLMDDSMGYRAQELELNSGSYQVKPVVSNLIASVGTNGTDLFSYNYNAVTDVYALVKYAGGVYYAKKADFGSYMVTMTGGGVSSAYLDWNEAIKEINSINDPAAEYVITINEMGEYLKDTVLTDNAEFGKLVLPNAKKCALLTVKSGSGEKRLYFTDSTLKLNTNVAFDGIKLCSRSSTLSFSLGSSSLTLKDIEFDNNMDITSISGAASNGTSVLAVDGCDIRVTGNISKVGSVKLLNAVELRSDGSIDIGNVYVYGENNSTLVGTTKVSFKEYKDKSGKTHRDLSSITPAITINGAAVGVANGGAAPKLQISLNVAEKSGNVYTYTDLGTYIKNYIAGDYKNNCITFANTTGINFAKATKAAAEDVVFITEYDYDPDHPNNNGKKGIPAGGMTVKKAGYLAYTGNSSVSYELVCDAGSYPCLTFEDAVTEINNINNKNGEYTVKITGDVDSRDVNPDAPEKFTMPKAGTYSLLVIEGQGATPVTLYYGVKGSNDTITAVNGISLTGNTVIKNVNFRDAEAYKIKHEEDEKENNQYHVDDTDTDYPNRAALNLSMGGKNLTLENTSFEGRALVIDGGTNGTKNAVLTLKGWAVAGKKISSLKSEYASAYVFEGEIRNIKDLKLPVGKKLLVRKYVAATSGTKKDAVLKVTSLTLNGNAIRSEGSITLTDVSTGAEASKSVIMADRAFTVSGKVFAGQYGNLALIGRSKSGSSVSPYLNITGTVTAESKTVAVGLLGYSVETTEMLKPGDALPILSASKCSAGQFAFITSADWSNAPKVEDKVATGIVITGYERDLVEEHRGYFLAKEGNYIKAYKGTSACVELVRTDDVTTPVEENVDNVLGYYKTVDEALKVITTKKDKNASYVILLLKDMGTENQPLTVSLPDAKLAKALAIQGINSNKVYLSKLSIVNDLSLVNIQVMVAGNVTMTKGKTLTLNNSNNNGAILKAQGSVALENIHNMADGELIFTRTEKNDSSQLKINGYVTNADGKQLRVYMENLWKNGHAQYSVDGYTVRAAADIKDTKLLFTAPYATQNDLDINIEGDNALSENVTDDGATVVKANNAFYYVKSDLRKGFAGLSIGDGAVAYYLDLNQALAQIKVYNDKTKDYTVQVGYLVGENSVIEDVNVIDKIDHSPIVMPTANTVRSLTIKTFSDNADKRTEINFSGDITAYVGANGKLELASLMLRPVKAANVNKAAVVSDTAKINVYRNTTDKTGEVTLVLSKTLLGNTAQGSFVNTIAGTKAVTNVVIKGCDVTLKNGFTNINRLYIDGRVVTTGGSNTLAELHMSDGSSAFISAGSTVLDTLFADNGSPVLGIKSADKFKINKTVAIQSDDGKVRVKLLAAKSTHMSVSYIDDNDPAYLDHNLVYAPLADASLFMAEPEIYREATVSGYKGECVAYKNGSYVCVGKKNKMHAFVSSDDGMLSAYAPDYYGAVAAIDTWKTKTAYTIKIFDDDATKQTKALTLPKAANCSSLLIRPESDGNGNVKFKFTGTLKPVSDTRFERVMLVCCNTSGVPQNEAAIDLSYASLDLWNSCTKADAYAPGEIYVSSIKGTKGELRLGYDADQNTNVYISGDVNMGTLNIIGNVNMRSTATAPKTMTIKNVNGDLTTSCLNIDAPISTAPLLKISGTIALKGIKIAPKAKGSNGIYGYLTSAELDSRRTTAADTAAALSKKRLAEMPSIDTAILTVQCNDGITDYAGGNVIKTGSYIYVTGQ